MLISLALRYAKSIFSLAKSEDAIEIYYQQLTEVDNLLKQSIDLKEVLESQRVAAKDKLNLVKKIFSSYDLNKNVYNFLKFLALRNRFIIFEEILKLFRELYHQYNQSLIVKITTSESLTENRKEEIKTRLESSFQCKVKLEEIVDRNILGGFFAQFERR